MGNSDAPRVALAKRLVRLAVRYVVLPLAALAAMEGLASAILLAHDVIAIKPNGNFRQAQYDSLVGWVSIPDMHRPDNWGPGTTLTTNADGIRVHRPVVETLPAGGRRIICSGDSFTFGAGVADDQTFCADLEHEFSGVQTLNMAQLGFGIDQAYLWYRRDGARYPHQVQAFAFIWHDFERMALRSFWEYPKPILALRHDSLLTENVPVPRWSGWTRWYQAGRLLPGLRMVQFVDRHLDLSDSAKLARVDDQVWPVAEAVFRDLDRLNRARGSQLVLVYLPAPPDLIAGAYDHRREMLAQFSQATGIPFVDLTPEIRKVPPDSSQWFFITANQLVVSGSSGHYTAAGHQWVASRLAEHFRSIPAVAQALGGR